jgi:hypothetical protein
MKEHIQPNHQHLEALHHVMDVPFREELGPRINKEQVLRDTGFSQGTNIALRREFQLEPSAKEADGIREHLIQQLENGRFIAMLFKDKTWDAVGGSPVTYIMDKEDLNTKLVFENEILVGARSHSGEPVSIYRPLALQTYSRRRSVASELSGFVNYDGSIPVRMGGGFRLQVDNLTYIDDHPHLLISGYFSFNDLGSRVLALSCDEDRKVPRFETSFLLQIEDGKLKLPEEKNEGKNVMETKEAGVVVNEVIRNLFERDGTAISRLIRGLLSVRPAMQVHQLEGIFSIPSSNEISAEVIDFDGIDSFDLSDQPLKLTPAEKLVNFQLRSMGYSVSDPEVLLSYTSFTRGVRAKVNEVSQSPTLSQDIKDEMARHFQDTMDVFAREQTGAVKLGRLFSVLNMEWDQTDDPAVKTANHGNNTLTMVSIEGFDLGFWNSNSGLVDCSDIHSRSSTLSKMIGREILPVHLSSLREGD